MSKIPSQVFVFVYLFLCISVCVFVFVYLCFCVLVLQKATLSTPVNNSFSAGKQREFETLRESPFFPIWYFSKLSLSVKRIEFLPNAPALRQVQLIPDRCLLLPFVSLSASKMSGKHLPRSKLRSKLTSGGDATVLRTGTRQQAQAFFSPGHSLTLSSCF